MFFKIIETFNNITNNGKNITKYEKINIKLSIYWTIKYVKSYIDFIFFKIENIKK